MKEQDQLDILDDWLRDHSALLFKIVRAYAFTEADREDLFQEISLQVWRSIPGFRQDSSVTTWLYRVSLNTALSWVRNERKHREGRHSMDGVQHLLKENETPADERLLWLYDEIGRLDEIDRSLALLLLDGFSYKEISGLLGITETNVGVKIHRIKKRLIAQSRGENDGI